jgi:GT2 family glycosyltransferase
MESVDLVSEGHTGDEATCEPRGSQLTRPSFGAVVLTMGARPVELEKALSTLLTQQGVDLDVVVVGNGWTPTGLPEGVRVVALEENVGIPEGRNIGARESRGEFLFFYDDDAALPTDDVLSRLAAVLEADRRTAIAQPRPVDPTGLPSPRRWVPRLRVGDGGRPGEVSVFWEGVFAIRRTAFEEVGGWPGFFFYAHEGIDLAWRLCDAGWKILYEPSILVNHPATSPTKHAVFYRMNARNRVWVARRNLPQPLALLYVATWVAIMVVRVRRPRPLRIWFRGLHEGLTTDCGPRSPIRWRTVLQMTASGRPPIV